MNETNLRVPEFFEVIDNLIYLNKANRNDSFSEHVSLRLYIKNFCTVLCDIGRATGKTSYIKSRATSKNLVIVHNMRLKRELYYDCVADVMSADTLENYSGGYFSGMHYNTIYIDEPRSVFAICSFDRIIDIFGMMSDIPTFVLLGQPIL